RPSVRIDTPNEGDVVLAPSSSLLITRSGGPIQNGYVMRSLIATPAGNSYTVQTPTIARYFVQGGKAALSFDERWLTFHHYVDADDWQELGYPNATAPGFQALLIQHAANIYVLDLTTGESRRVTNMGPGQLALYPHFRSDGWIYAIVKDKMRARE